METGLSGMDFLMASMAGGRSGASLFEIPTQVLWWVVHSGSLTCGILHRSEFVLRWITEKNAVPDSGTDGWNRGKFGQ